MEDKYISDIGDLLDQLSDDYEEILNKRLDEENLDNLIKEVIDDTNANAKTIKETLEREAHNVGYDITSKLTDIWSPDGTTTKVVGTYFSNLAGNINTSLNGENGVTTTIKNSVDATTAEVGRLIEYITENMPKAKDDSNPTGDGTGGNTGGNTGGDTGGGNNDPIGNETTEEQREIQRLKELVDEYHREELKYINAQNKMASSSGTGRSKAVVEMQNIEATMHTILRRAGVNTFTELNNKLKKLRGYKSGAKRINNNLAWTQEHGAEVIIRPSDGAILTPLKMGDSVLSKTATDNLWKAANDPSKFVKDSLIGNALSDITSHTNNGSYVQNFENVTFNMPNVKNYEQLISQMQSDKNFEKLILAMSVDRLAGGSSLGKYKAVR